MLNFISTLSVSEVVTLITIFIGLIISYSSISNRIANIETRNAAADRSMQELKESVHKYFDDKHNIMEGRIKEIEVDIVTHKTLLGRIDERLGFIQSMLEKMSKKE